MKIGIIFVGFNTEEYVEKSLAPWIEARKNKLDGHEFLIPAVSLPFKGFTFDSVDKTTEILAKKLVDQEIDYLITGPRFIPETSARTIALKWLIDQKVDIVWQFDSDEFITIKQISDIIKFIQKNSGVAWMRLSYKNYVFNEKTYIVEPFKPARIHRVNFGEFRLHEFWDDNNISYVTHDNSMGEIGTLDTALSTITIPKSVAWIKHLTWLNNERSMHKIAYQKIRNWTCSFDWDNERGLIWNEKYFLDRGESRPEIEVEA